MRFAQSQMIISISIYLLPLLLYSEKTLMPILPCPNKKLTSESEGLPEDFYVKG